MTFSGADYGQIERGPEEYEMEDRSTQQNIPTHEDYQKTEAGRDLDQARPLPITRDQLTTLPYPVSVMDDSSMEAPTLLKQTFSQ